ncbi:hypothetical protein HHK36_008299 [Tetracentron sinense]|uniref:Protein FAR1-RELATED SEQUENCE n=1 Tax=Tetracentron sinense TaxID=13715 RepID=A0A834ZF76_TETSI|nr:hypothetical protein HHK36_008299 [Tetracentron sinense]
MLIVMAKSCFRNNTICLSPSLDASAITVSHCAKWTSYLLIRFSILLMEIDFERQVDEHVMEDLEEKEFDTYEEAYSVYREYAKSIGFGTSKLSSRRSKKNGEFIDAQFGCSNYGSKKQSAVEVVNPRPSQKTNCKASVSVKNNQNGKWFVYRFVKEHNHQLFPSHAHYFRSHRRINPTTKSNIDILHGIGIQTKAGDAQAMLEHFTHLQKDNPDFFYAMDLNDDQQLRNVFWVDAKNETTSTFVWLMRTWLRAMGRVPPRAIVTDQDKAMKAAIAEEHSNSIPSMPPTCDDYCGTQRSMTRLEQSSSMSLNYDSYYVP